MRFPPTWAGLNLCVRRIVAVGTLGLALALSPFAGPAAHPAQSANVQNGPAPNPPTVLRQTTSVSGAVPATITTIISDSSGALQNGIIDVEVYNAVNQKIGQQYFSGQNLFPGQRMTYNVIWSPPSAAIYHVVVGVYGANWTPLMLWDTNAATFVVSSASSISAPPTPTAPLILPTAPLILPTATVIPPTPTIVPPSATATAVPPTPTSTSTTTATLIPSTATAVPPTVTPTSIGTNVLADLKVISYYPAANSWTNMWTNWDPLTINSDFARIAALHANAVRIIIQTNTFGYPTPDPIMQAHLAQIISMAQSNGLKVQLTLFDWWGDYTDLTGSEQWADAVLAPFAGNPAIAFVELQNEIDTSDSTVLAWTQQMIPYLQSITAGIPVTVSVNSLGNLQTLVSALRATPPDFYDFHFYDGAYLAYTDLQQAQQLVAPTPLFIGETGFSTSLFNTSVGGLPANAAAMEAYQDYYFRSVDYAAESLGLPPPAPWILSDFVPGTVSWVVSTSPEYDYGIYRADGWAKPVAGSLAGVFAGTPVDTSFNNGFENCALGEPVIWLMYHPTEGTFACDTSVAHSGTTSARISASTGDVNGVPSFFTSPTNAHVVPGQVYTAAVWARGQNLTGTTQIALAWFDATGNYLGTDASPTLPTGTTTWTHLTVSSMAPAGAAFVQIHCKSTYNSGIAWFDDVTYS